MEEDGLARTIGSTACVTSCSLCNEINVRPVRRNGPYDQRVRRPVTARASGLSSVERHTGAATSSTKTWSDTQR